MNSSAATPNGDYILAGIGEHEIALAFTTLDDPTVFGRQLFAINGKFFAKLLVRVDRFLIWPTPTREAAEWMRAHHLESLEEKP